MEPKLKVGFIGAGKMATALAQGLVRAGVTTADRMIGSDVSEAATGPEGLGWTLS